MGHALKLLQLAEIDERRILLTTLERDTSAAYKFATLIESNLRQALMMSICTYHIRNGEGILRLKVFVCPDRLGLMAPRHALYLIST